MMPAMINRRKFIKQCSHAGTAVIITSSSLNSVAWNDEAKFDQQQYILDYLDLNATEAGRQDYLKEKLVQELAPVVLAEPGATPYNHKHLGWPVAAIIDDTIVVAIKTWAGEEWHSEGKIPFRGPFIVCSVDGGKTWSKPVYPHVLNNIEMTFPEREGMLALGTTKSGKVIFIHRDNVFISEDKGKTWSHRIAKGLRGSGPRIIEHPDWGLIHVGGSGEELVFFVSQDEGMKWREIKIPTKYSPALGMAEPTIFSWDNKQIALLVRNHTGPITGIFGHFRIWSYLAQLIPVNISTAKQFEDLKFDYRLSNIWGRRMDTNDVIYNPVTKRIEAVHTKRNEGFPYRDNGYMTLNLWSIDPGRFARGDTNWRFECVLLRSKGMKSRSYNPEFPPRDGMHPAGSIIDEKRGVQHIFIYRGDRSHSGPNAGKTGVFRISRTLDTGRLREESREADNFDKIFQINERFDSLNDWTLSGRPLMIWVEPEQVDRDCTRMLREPLPEGLVQADDHGLYINTNEPGYYGLHNENTIVTQNYTLEFKAKIERYASEGDSLGVGVQCGAQKQHLILRKDGLYELVGPGKSRRIKAIDMDNYWHVWKVEMNEGSSGIYIDGTFLTSAPAMIYDRLGRNDAPVSIYAETTNLFDPAEVRMEYFKFENIE
jgi:hypothetical protein